MGGFWSALGGGLEDYAKARMAGKHHAGGGLGQMVYGAIHPPNAPQQQPDDLYRDPATTQGQPGAQGPMPDMDRGMENGPDLSMNPPDGADMMGAGKMVTQPTLAMVGDKGPEAVVPLTDQPGAKVTPGMLGGSPRTRWGHPAGPVAAKRTAPMRGVLPVKPNATFR